MTQEKLNVDALAQEIRRVDGGNKLGAGALAEALMPFINSTAPASQHPASDALLEAIAKKWDADDMVSAFDFAAFVASFVRRPVAQAEQDKDADDTLRQALDDMYISAYKFGQETHSHDYEAFQRARRVVQDLFDAANRAAFIEGSKQ